MGEPGRVAVAAPFREYRSRVPREWIDYNGHMHDSSYATALSDANELLLAALGVGASYHQATGRAMYTVEAHLFYLAGAVLGDLLSAETVLVHADDKRLRLCTVLSHGDGEPVAEAEHLYLHVDTTTGRVEPFPPEVATTMAEVLSRHAALPFRPRAGGARPTATAPGTSSPSASRRSTSPP